ncbi:MAG: hypothetical protein VXW22_06245 [Pseudomonadota bacterium]|nr:hypothetical protein [Pseudomonadota bacterium]
MTPDARLCLQKTWPLIERRVIEIGLIVSLLKPLARAEHLEMLRLVRLAEGLMRRWLVLSACARPLPEPRPGRAGGGFSGIDMGMPSGLGLPLFRLADPEPKSKAAPGADRPAEPFRILALQDDPPVPVPVPVPGPPVCISAEIPASFPTPVPTPSRADLRLWERANALLGAMREPDKQIARMRRFLAKSLSGLGPFPLRLARPWGQSAKARRARPEAYAALKDLRVFTRDALIAQAAPG